MRRNDLMKADLLSELVLLGGGITFVMAVVMILLAALDAAPLR